MKYKLEGKVPEIADDVYIAPGAHVIGDVVLKQGSSVWFNAVLRADNAKIEIGEGTNIQDGSVLHVDDNVPLTVHDNVTVGHKVMLHGCEVGEYSLVGINAVILNGAKIGKYCVIGANALIPENKEIPDGSVVMGSPGKVIKTLTEEQRVMLKMSALHYKEKAAYFTDNLEALD